MDLRPPGEQAENNPSTARTPGGATADGETGAEPPADTGMVDADQFLGFTSRLRRLHARLAKAKLARGQLARLQRRLADIADRGRSDLGAADSDLVKLEGELDRVTRD